MKKDIVPKIKVINSKIDLYFCTDCNRNLEESEDFLIDVETDEAICFKCFWDSLY